MPLARGLLGPLLAATCATGTAPSRTPVVAPPTADAPTSSSPTLAESTAAEDVGPVAEDTPGAARQTQDEPTNDTTPADELPPDLLAILGVVDGIVFEIGREHLRVDASRPALDRLVDTLARHPDVRVEIQVHTDSGSVNPPYGRCLTCDRAEVIVDYLVAQGIDQRRLRAQGYGAERPIASNDTKEGRQRNRRVEVLLLDGDGNPVPGGEPCRAGSSTSKGSCELAASPGS